MSVPSHRSDRQAQSGGPIESGGESTRASPDAESSARPELGRRSGLGIISNLFRYGNVVERIHVAPSRRRWRDRPHRPGPTTDRDHKFSAGLCRRCHDQALTPTSILCPASASAATGISRCIRPVPTMPVRRSLSVCRPGFSPHPPELHPAGRRIALKPPYPAHRPLLRSLRRGGRERNRAAHRAIFIHVIPTAGNQFQ